MKAGLFFIRNKHWKGVPRISYQCDDFVIDWAIIALFQETVSQGDSHTTRFRFLLKKNLRLFIEDDFWKDVAQKKKIQVSYS